MSLKLIYLLIKLEIDREEEQSVMAINTCDSYDVGFNLDDELFVERFYITVKYGDRIELH